MRNALESKIDACHVGIQKVSDWEQSGFLGFWREGHAAYSVVRTASCCTDRAPWLDMWALSTIAGYTDAALASLPAGTQNQLCTCSHAGVCILSVLLGRVGNGSTVFSATWLLSG